MTLRHIKIYVCVFRHSSIDIGLIENTPEDPDLKCIPFMSAFIRLCQDYGKENT